MRLINLARGDIHFQWKYGFYILYAIFTVLYFIVLTMLPSDVKATVATVLIFTDPAAMGLFFMGAIILLEKSQNVDSALAVSPIKPIEYMFSKLISLSAIGLLVGIILAIVGGISNIFTCIISIILTSFICSACGLIAANKSKSMNQFVLLAVPFELLICLPPVLLLFGIENPWLMLHPGVASVWLIYGDSPNMWLCLLSLILWCVLTIYFCLRSVKKYFATSGGEVQ